MAGAPVPGMVDALSGVCASRIPGAVCSFPNDTNGRPGAPVEASTAVELLQAPAPTGTGRATTGRQ